MACVGEGVGVADFVALGEGEGAIGAVVVVAAGAGVALARPYWVA
jgi:hypothetical protein